MLPIKVNPERSYTPDNTPYAAHVVLHEDNNAMAVLTEKDSCYFENIRSQEWKQIIGAYRAERAPASIELRLDGIKGCAVLLTFGDTPTFERKSEQHQDIVVFRGKQIKDGAEVERFTPWTEEGTTPTLARREKRSSMGKRYTYKTLAFLADR